MANSKECQLLPPTSKKTITADEQRIGTITYSLRKGSVDFAPGASGDSMDR